MANLTLRHIYKVYPNGVKAVNDFNMEIQDEEFIVFVGPSGCGKSTTLRMIAGLEEISAGELYINDKFVNYTEPKNRDIAMVFQNYALYPHLNVYENIAFGLRLRHLPKAEIDEKVHKAAEMLGLTDYLKTKPGALSGGQRQRVALGRALVREPKVFLLDEPLSNLDAKLRGFMRGEITKLHSKLKTTFIYVTHDQVEAMTMGDRIVVMKDGFIQQIDTPKNLYRYPINKFVANFIGTPQMNFSNVTLAKEKDKIRLDVTNTDTSFLLPREYFLKVDPQYFDGQTSLSLALRSEYASIDPKEFPYTCKVKIVGVEELGTEIQLLTDFDINRDVLTLDTGNDEVIKTSLAIRTDADYEGKVNDIITISLDLKHLHIFDNETEMVINPRLPTYSRVKCLIKQNTLHILNKKVNLPKAMPLKDGEFDVVIPINSLTINKNDKELEIYDVEKIDDKYLVQFFQNGEVLFALSNEELRKGDKVGLDISLTELDFYQNKELVFSHLNSINELEGMVYYHKEKNEEHKKVKVLDYLIDDLELSCYNDLAYRTFITASDRSIYDQDLIFKFTPEDIYLDKDGLFELVVKDVLDYDSKKYALCIYKEKELLILLKEGEEVGVNQKIKASINADMMQVFDKKKSIRLV